ncbi:MAG TPA: DinB family protein [Pedobacter sp.]|nr:DinB family protein [Pedobacter sp.]
MSDPILQLWLYNNWANELFLNALKQNPDAGPKCLRLFSHITNAQLIWMSRIAGEEQPVGVWDEQSLATCEEHHLIFIARMPGIFSNKEETTAITYKNTQNVIFRDAMRDILLHTFNHGTYHRAQLAQGMKRNRIEPPVSDYIIFKRLGY